MDSLYVGRSVSTSNSTDAFSTPLVLSAKIPEEKPLLYPQVALDGVQDPGNLGAILRTCDAAGFSAALGEGCADPFSPKAVRAAMGSMFRVPFGKRPDLAAYLRAQRERGVERRV